LRFEEGRIRRRDVGREEGGGEGWREREKAQSKANRQGEGERSNVSPTRSLFNSFKPNLLRSPTPRGQPSLENGAERGEEMRERLPIAGAPFFRSFVGREREKTSVYGFSKATIKGTES